MIKKSFLSRAIYFLRNKRSKELFRALATYCSGNVLDVGGWDFYLEAKKRKIKFESWTILELTKEFKPDISDKNFKFVVGDGCKMKFKNNSFDTVLNIQVLEHVFEPLRMIKEISRVLKPGGFGIFLIPQTSTLHMLPHHYYNFTRFWIEEAMKKNDLKIIELKPLGGIWSSLASHLVYFFFQSTRFPGMSPKECKRNLFFYILYPFMCLYAIINIPISLFFSLGDLAEEPNNYLIVVKKLRKQNE